MNGSIKILLTGGTGFIGLRIKKLLMRSGHRLIILTRKDKYRRDSSSNFIQGDITNPKDCEKATRTTDIIIHSAGVKREQKLYEEVNKKGTANLVEAALINKVTHFIHISSVGVIGADPLSIKTYDESEPCYPNNDYEKSKRAAEKYVIDAKKRGLLFSILRPANVFGDGDPENSLLNLFRNIKLGRFAYLGGRKIKCNYVYVGDVARAVLAIANNQNAIGNIYHLADSCVISEFIDHTADLLGVDRPKFTCPKLGQLILTSMLKGIRKTSLFHKSSFAARLISLNNQAVFKSSKIYNELGFNYQIGWKKGLARTVAWYRSQGVL